MSAIGETGRSGSLARLNVPVTSALPPIAAVEVILVKRAAIDPKRTLEQSSTFSADLTCQEESAVTLNELGNIGEFVSSIGVIVSLVYLAVQIRKNTETERTSTYQSVVSDFGSLNATMSSNPELSYLFAKAMENFGDLDSGEKARVSQLFFATFHYFENMYYQNRKGYLEEDVWRGWERLMLTYYARPGFQTWWSIRRDVFSESFGEFLETSKLDKHVASYSDVTQLNSDTTLPE
jgi:hypothetical protein